MSITANLTTVQQQLRDAVAASGRPAGAVDLIAVSKFHPQQAVVEALAAGQRKFGENRVQEAKGKFPDLRAAYPDLELHLIGPLQTNKADEAVRIFDVIETLDRPALAAALAKAMKKADRWLPCFIEINIGGEAQKAGLPPEQLGDFLRLCRGEHHLTVTGLMCIPPQGDDPRPHFAAMQRLATTHQLPHLSMGMSADFATAIDQGATLVRIGTAIFGNRTSP